MEFRELSDEQWKFIKPYLPPQFAWLKIGFRKIASRYERLNVVFKGLLDIACFILCWKKV